MSGMLSPRYNTRVCFSRGAVRNAESMCLTTSPITIASIGSVVPPSKYLLIFSYMDVVYMYRASFVFGGKLLTKLFCSLINSISCLALFITKSTSYVLILILLKLEFKIEKMITRTNTYNNKTAIDMKVLGDWINRIDDLSEQFASAKPYEHIVIDGFFSTDTFLALVREFPTLDQPNWFQYHNPIEKKFAMNRFEKLPTIWGVMEVLSSPEFVKMMQKVTGIDDLENDPYLHGAGLHCHPRGGKLDMHLDYSIHPVTGKERRVNLIVYLNEVWERSWHGDLQLWNSSFTECEKRVYPFMNRAAIFRTSDISYHGMPTPLECPVTQSRKSLAIYYVSDPRPQATPRYKAMFRPLPWQPQPEALKKLYTIRETRILTEADLNDIYPDWEQHSGNGFW